MTASIVYSFTRDPMPYSIQRFLGVTTDRKLKRSADRRLARTRGQLWERLSETNDDR